MRRGFTLAETLVAIAIAVGALTLAYDLWRYSDRYFRKSQTSLELQVGARTLAESAVRDIRAAHTMLPPQLAQGGGKVLRMVRYMGDDAADLASRKAVAFWPGEVPPNAASGTVPESAASRGFAALQVEYDWDAKKGVVTRVETQGTWYWVTDAAGKNVLSVKFDAKGAPRVEEKARNVTQLAAELLGYTKAGQLETIGSLEDADLPYRGDGERTAAAALVLLRIHSRVEAPAGQVGEVPDVDLVTKAWCGRRGLAGVAGPLLTSLDEAPAQ
jgi:prepilin-type N-terminal cleavage/methylation domain-containing protein